jgi:hypothetical protein
MFGDFLPWTVMLVTFVIEDRYELSMLRADPGLRE